MRRTETRSRCERLPILRDTRRLSRVKSLTRTSEAARNPHAAASASTTSWGQWLRAAVVIMAKIVLPDASFAPAAESASAGRGLACAMSVKGKGTTATSPASQIVIGPLVLGACPFGERVFHRLEIGAVDRLGLRKGDLAAFGDAVDEQITGLHAERGAHFLRDRGLRLRGDFAENRSHVSFHPFPLTVRQHGTAIQAVAMHLTSAVSRKTLGLLAVSARLVGRHEDEGEERSREKDDDGTGND